MISMKFKFTTILLILVVLFGCSSKDLQKSLDIINASSADIPLKKPEVIAGLKDALARGISKAAINASATNGYLNDSRLKIPFPPEVKKVEKALRKLGLGKEVDRFVVQLNRGAEKAAARAKPVFIKAITSMTVRDAFDLLNGDQNAATQYLIRTTGDDLRKQFRPIVNETLGEVKATKYYGDIVKRYNKIPLVNKVNPDLEGYATDQAIKGLFLLVAEEEANIRANPRARTTKLLRRVFGSLDL
jgi:hypothetical protein